jgi:hypothetical protein
VVARDVSDKATVVARDVSDRAIAAARDVLTTPVGMDAGTMNADGRLTNGGVTTNRK